MSNSPFPSLSAASLREVLRPLVHPDDLDVLLRGHVRVRELARSSGPAALLSLKPATQRRLAAAFELARRREREDPWERPAVGGPGDVLRLLPELRDEPVEVFRVLLLDARHRVMAGPEVSRGTLTNSLVHPREVFRPAIVAGAAAVILAHNHPSGSARPSPEDDAVTRRLADAGRLLGIPVLDHVIVGEREHTSYRERGAVPLGDAS